VQNTRRLADREIKVRLADLGVVPFAGSPADFGKHIAADIEKWAEVIRVARIEPEQPDEHGREGRWDSVR
jgi:tripartite-type tricarboxylate transporter receptor subunit TctC